MINAAAEPETPDTKTSCPTDIAAYMPTLSEKVKVVDAPVVIELNAWLASATKVTSPVSASMDAFPGDAPMETGAPARVIKIEAFGRLIRRSFV